MSISPPPAPLASIVRFVRKAQRDLQQVERWSHHHPTLEESALEYAGILPIIATLVLGQLRHELAFNETLVRDALAICQLGSIRYKEAGRDPPFPERMPIHAQREFRAAMDHAMLLPWRSRKTLLRPLLLPWIRFPLIPQTIEELAILNDLRRTATIDANVFWLIIHFSFVLRAIGEYEENKNQDIVVEALRTAHDELSRFATLFPDFGLSFYTSAVAKWARKTLAAADPPAKEPDDSCAASS